MSIDTRALDQMLAELRTASTAASGKPAAQNTPAAGGADFAAALKRPSQRSQSGTAIRPADVTRVCRRQQ